jgi:hypothetical protein
MNASDYVDVERFEIGVVEFVQKAKNCGKENCGACPHKGYWYARLPLYFIRNGAAREVYLGRAWTDGDLRKKVAPLLLPGRDKSFLALVDQIVVKEHIVRLLDEAADHVARRKHLDSEYKRQVHLSEMAVSNTAKALVEARKRLAALGKTAATGA